MAGSELVTLFGDELAEVRPSRVGTEVANGTKVSIRDLAAMIVAVGVAELVVSGAATLAEQEVKRLWRSKTTITIRSDEAGEGFTLAVSRASSQPIEVSKLVAGILGARIANPDQAVIALAHRLLEPTGAVVDTGGRGRRMATKLGYSPYAIQAERAESLRPEWSALKERWASWSSGNGALAGRLVEEARRAMAEAKEYVDTGLN